MSFYINGVKIGPCPKCSSDNLRINQPGGGINQPGGGMRYRTPEETLAEHLKRRLK